MNVEKLITDFLKIQNGYSHTKRTLVTGDRYKQAIEQKLIAADDYSNDILLEPLIEHVGHLPILAAYWHPHISHSKDVDLGRSLSMLAIHDIGETVLGDVFTYSKTNEDAEKEFKTALELLHPSQQVLLTEYEEKGTMEAKYAKSIDALAPLIHEADMPKVTLEHFYNMGATIEDIVNKKRPLVEWDEVLCEVFDTLIEHFQRAHRGEEPIFSAETYDIN